MQKQILVILLLITFSFSKVVEITSIKQFEEVLAQNDKLLLFDLYADWCGPCKMLAPILDEISKETNKAAIYKINTEKLRTLAAEFGVTSIPHVTFVKNKQALNTQKGLLPKEAYEQSIEILDGTLKNSADGTVQNGIRTIEFDPTKPIDNIHVYRGDKVKLITNKKGMISLPDLSLQGKFKSNTEFTFTAKKNGAFPILFSTTADSSTAVRKAWLIVLQYNAPTKATIYKELSENEFEKGLKSEGALLLDVRTDGEYKEDHLVDARLIPVQDLEKRMSELDIYKNKPIYVYCRSGNRSTVASKMLLDKGFTEVYNLRNGIKGWRKAGKSTVK